jgi:hypothetical protein
MLCSVPSRICSVTMRVIFHIILVLARRVSVRSEHRLYLTINEPLGKLQKSVMVIFELSYLTHEALVMVVSGYLTCGIRKR